MFYKRFHIRKRHLRELVEEALIAPKMEDAASPLAAPSVDATTPAHPSTATQSHSVSVPADDPRGPPSSPLPSSETGLARKGSHEWASPRSQGRRGTPPPIPRRGSRADDAIDGTDLPSRPRTPAQVLASRAQAAGKATTATVSGQQDGTSPETPPPHDLLPPQAPQNEGSSSSSSKVMEPESGPSTAILATGDGEREDQIERMEHGYGGNEADIDGRQTVLQLSVLSDVESEECEEDGDGDGDGRLYRREERGDTSTVDEESMYNDNEDEDDDAEEEDEEQEEEDADHDHASIGTSDEYVNIHQEGDDSSENDNEDEQLRQRGGSHGDDSLTPDNTPPPSPPRPTNQHHQQAPPVLPSEWIKYVAESGHEYYYNSRTHASQWSRPGALPVSPRGSLLAMNDAYHEENQALVDDHAHEMPAQVPVHVMHVSVAAAVPTSTPSYANALFAAVTKNDETAQLQELLLYDVDVNTVHASSGLTPLHVAVQHGNARGAAMLLDYGARVDGPESTVAMDVGTGAIETPLVMACRTNHATLVRLLVRYGASIYTRDVDGNTILHIAIRCWSDDVVYCLLEMDSIAAILNLRNTEEETPLHLAARHGNANAVRALLASGAAVDVEDARGRTPLVVSIMENRVDCAQLLQLGEAQHSDAQDVTVAVEDQGPIMYDDTGENNTVGRRDGTGRDTIITTAQEYVSEAESLRVYLTHLLQHSATDAVLASTVYQFADAVQREMASMATSANEAREREETLLHRIDELTNFQSTTSHELAEARETTDLLREQMETKEHELISLQTAYESLASRATMLESIARSSQDKLRRERAEFARQEEYWSQTINNSLQENATLLQSVQSLQQQQQQHDGWSQQYPMDETTRMETQDDSMGSHEEYEDTMEVQQSYEPRDEVQSGENEAYSSDAYDHYTQDPSVEMSSYYGQTDAGYAMTTQLSTETTSVDPESERATATISPERVDAVWNRFFENMARASDMGGAAAPAPTPATRSRPLSPPLRNPTLSPRHATGTTSPTAYPMLAVLPPASAVFDCVRKDNKDRLHQLLLSGISPNVRDIGERGTPLHLASELGDLEAVMLLCEFGGDVEIRDENGNTPLLMACAQGHFDCTKFLLQSAANHAAINESRDTALHLAAWDGSVDCVAMLLEYGVDVLARNSLGLTALANLKTRSPLRHRFQDLVRDHPMAKTLALLEEAERLEMSDGDERDQPHLSRKNQSSTTSKAMQDKSANKTHDSKPPQTNNASWGRWILGSVFGSAATPRASSPAERGNDSDGDDEEDEDESKSDFEEAESSPRDTRATGFLPDYEDLRPPPEIEAALRRSKPGVASPTAKTPSLRLPPPPPEILDELEKWKLDGSSTRLLSPTNSATRFASPASIAAVKRPGQTTPTNVRSRYVDTFNNP